MRQRKSVYIDCLMVSRPSKERFELWKKSIECFRRQTFPNCRLIILLNNLNEVEKKSAILYLEKLNQKNIEYFYIDGNYTLGKLRNLCIESSRAPILCQWDDDDISHPRRLEKQIELMMKEKSSAVFLQEHFHLFLKSKRLFWCDWSLWSDPIKALPGTIMFKRERNFRYPERGISADLGEDREIYLCYLMNREEPISLLRGNPHLYIYIFHEKNSWDILHHHAIARSLLASKNRQIKHIESIQAELSVLEIKLGEVEVMLSPSEKTKIFI